MKKLLTVCLLAFAAAGATGCRSAAEGVKPKLMWLDCSANWVRFSYPDSIRYYVNKCREAGMTALVLDVKGTSSEGNGPAILHTRLGKMAPIVAENVCRIKRKQTISGVATAGGVW